MNRIVLSVRLVLRSPFLFPGLGGGAFGLDACALRDAAGRALVPQDQLRGVLRHAVADAVGAMRQPPQAVEERLFGRASADARGPADVAPFDPQRGRLLLGDLAAAAVSAPEGSAESARAVRVRIEPETMAADPGGLMTAELAAPPGAEVAFVGQATLFATDAEARPWIDALKAAATWVSAIGAMKSAGFGEVVAFEIAEASRASLAPAAARPVDAERRAWRIAIDRPFLVDARRAAANLYVGADVIPGGVMKGALARKLELSGALKRLEAALTALRIGHARPEDAPDPIPLSLVAGPGGAVGDALTTPRGQGAMLGGAPARFAPDWKAQDLAAVRGALGVGEPPALGRDPRMHVAIDRARGAAVDEMLFATDAVVPGEIAPGRARRWRLEADFAAVADAEARALLCAALEDGLDGVGRTGARLDFEPVAADPVRAPAPVAWRADAWAVTLRTDAVMADPEDGAEAWDAYAAYWARVCPGGRLESMFARQRLAGGYVARRFRVGDGYRPFWLTEAGSVFLLSGPIRDSLAALVRDGLPAPVVGGRPTDWRSCPYQPQNGWGEIAADYDARLVGEVGHV